VTLRRTSIILAVTIVAVLTLPCLGHTQNVWPPPWLPKLPGSNAAAEAHTRAMNLLNAERYPEAIQYLDEAIRLDPRYAVAFSNRGVAYYSLGQYEQAIKDYDEAIRLDPRHVSAYTGRCGSYNSLGQHQQAMQDCNEAIRLDPRNADAHNNRGVAYY
jgi:Tfp pilus assembly protein PilF